MTLDENLSDDVNDDRCALALKMIDTFAKNRVYISKTPNEMRKTDYECKQFVKSVFPNIKDVAICLAIYDNKVRIYTAEMKKNEGV